MTEPTDPVLIPGADLPEASPETQDNARDDQADEEQLIEEGPAPSNLDVSTPFERPDPTEAPLPAERVEELTGEQD